MARSNDAFGSGVWALVVVGALGAPALGQTGGGFDLTWSSIDCGGGTSSGGTLVLDMTLGQADAGVMTGGTLTLSGGFWAVPPAAACYANCDGSTTPPLLNANDFGCFLNRFTAGCT